MNDICERLEAAFDVFLQYGFRKTSMDDLARGIGISRQALYLHFKNKQEIFDATCEQVARVSEAQAADVLAQTDMSIKERTAKALDCLMGVHIDALRGSPHGKELIAVAEDGEVAETRFQEVYEFFKGVYRQQDVTGMYGSPDDLALTVVLVLKGLIHAAKSRDDFNDKAARVLDVLFSSEG